jgi:DinB superfamily
MSVQISQLPVDRITIRAEWDAMHTEYYELIASISPSIFKLPTIDTRWSIAEILTHMIQTLEVMPQGIESIRRGKDFMNLPLTMVGASNFILVKMIARKVTPQALLARYDRAFNAAIKAWDGVEDGEWSKGAHLFGEGYKTLLDYYRQGPVHFKEHAAQIRKSLPSSETRTAN